MHAKYLINIISNEKSWTIIYKLNLISKTFMLRKYLVELMDDVNRWIDTLTKQSWKWRRMRLAPIRGSDPRACWTALETMEETFGQVEE